MAAKRSLGVTEARLGLSMLTALLLAVGYIALQRVGATHEAPPVEIRSGTETTPLSGDSNTRPSGPEGLHVLRAQNPESSDVPHTSQMPAFSLPPRIDLREELDRSDTELAWPVTPIGGEEASPAGKLR